MPDAQAFRQAWGMFATGVSVITTIESEGHVHGMAANGITSVSVDPLLVLVCVGHNRNSYPLIKRSGRFAINILNESQKSIAEHYASPPEQRSADGEPEFKFTERGSAILEGALASMDCHVVKEHETGDHTIFIAEVDDIQVNPGQPLLFFGGKYGQLQSNGSAP